MYTALVGWNVEQLNAQIQMKDGFVNYADKYLSVQQPSVTTTGVYSGSSHSPLVLILFFSLHNGIHLLHMATFASCS